MEEGKTKKAILFVFLFLDFLDFQEVEWSSVCEICKV